MKKLLIGYLILMACVIVYKILSSFFPLLMNAPSESVEYTPPPAPPMQTESKSSAASRLSSQVFSIAAEQLKSTCAVNDYGFTEDECLKAIEERKDKCQQKVTRQQPVPVADTSGMQTVLKKYASCIFEK